jgi:hypothetical protein
MTNNNTHKKLPNEIYRCQHGSHLYGTAIKGSDTNEKGVFVESIKNIVLGKARTTIRKSTSTTNEQNNKLDYDLELIELRKFLYDVMKGRPYALEMIFCPLNMRIRNTKLWLDILEFKDKIVCKNVDSYTGYCKSIVNQYNLKGSHLYELNTIIHTLSKYDLSRNIEGVIFPKSLTSVKWDKINDQRYLSAFNKKFSLNTSIETIYECMVNLKTKYREKTEQANDNVGIDWKDISHAFRYLYQSIALLKTGVITFPLPEAEYIKDIEAETFDWNDIKHEIPTLIQQVEAEKITSKLPDQPNYKLVDHYILERYIRN